MIRLNTKKINLPKIDFSSQKTKNLLLILVLLFTLLTRGVNMFNYPAYREDEGTYISQAWSVLTKGQLAPYTYWYDHPPFGWIFMAGYYIISGFFMFGSALNTGRVFMLILNVISAYLIFKIIFKISKNFYVGLFAAILFIVTPLGIDAQRRVLLDTIMIFWVLLSVNSIINKPLTLIDVIKSSIFFSLAVLSKETVIIFFPIFLLMLILNADKKNKTFAITLWVTISVFILSFYPLIATLKGEILPTGTFLGGNNPHVSLFDAVKFQLTRGTAPDSTLGYVLRNSWAPADIFTLIVGTVATLYNLIFHHRKKPYLFISLLSLTFILYLAHGGIVLDWYIVPLLPLFALNITLMFFQYYTFVTQSFSKAKPYLILLIVIFFLPLVVEFKNLAPALYFSKQTNNEVAAINWIKQNLPNGSFIVIDNYAYPDLHILKNKNDRVFNLANYYSKVDLDPEIRLTQLNGNWQNADYILYTKAMETSMNDENLDFIKQMVNNSTVIKEFDTNVGLKEPYWVQIREINNPAKYLKFSWDTYQNYFIDQNGRVIDRSQNDRTTSEGQSYALLRAVWSNDQSTFDKVWQWTKSNLQVNNRYVFAWLYENNSQGQGSISDPSSASDADEDIAFSLILASRRWNNTAYLQEAQNILGDIWQYDTVVAGGNRYISGGSWVPQSTPYFINPSYLAPYEYRIFNLVDTNHNWESLISSSYQALESCSSLGKVHIPSNWCTVTPDGAFGLPAGNSTTTHIQYANVYWYDAVRVWWRVALDYQWFQEPKAIKYLQESAPFWQNQWQNNHIIYSQYDLNGKPLQNTESLTQYSALVSLFSVVNPQIANDMYNQKVYSQFHWGQLSYYGDQNNYYDQNWVWFGIGLYANNFKYAF